MASTSTRALRAPVWRTWFFQGGYRSFRSYAFLFPDRGIGVFGLMNVNTLFSDGSLRELVPNLARLELGLPVKQPDPDHSYGILLTALLFAVVLQLGRLARCLSVSSCFCWLAVQRGSAFALRGRFPGPERAC